MNPTTSIEERLATAYAVEPGGGFDAVDARLAAAMAGAVEPHPRLVRRRAWKILLLAAALLVLVGATISALRLLGQVATVTPGMSVAWDRGVGIGQRQVSGGYAVTLERGYADLNQVILGVSVEPVAGVRNESPVLDTELRGPAGVELQPGALSFGAGSPQGDAEMLVFHASATVEGEYTLRLGLQGPFAAIGPPLTYRFSLPDAGGASIRVGESQQTEAGVLTLGAVRLSPTTIVASLHLAPSSPETPDWGPIGYFEHGDLTIELAQGGGDGAAEPTWTGSTVNGVDDPTGAWTLVVTELVGDREDGSQVRLQGPWAFSFEVP